VFSEILSEFYQNISSSILFFTYSIYKPFLTGKLSSN
jgi:hypothetical protein